MTGFTSGAEAVAAFRAEPTAFDLVVTDDNMPEISGLQVARQLLALRSELPVMLVSGLLTEELRAEALEVGIRRIFLKPYRIEDFCAAIAELAPPTAPAPSSSPG